VSEVHLDGWECEQTEHVNAARRSGPGRPSVDLYVDSGAMDVSAEEGRGYLAQSVSFSVPTSVLVRMLAHAGLVVPVCTCVEKGATDRGDVERCGKHGGAA